MADTQVLDDDSLTIPVTRDPSVVDVKTHGTHEPLMANRAFFDQVLSAAGVEIVTKRPRLAKGQYGLLTVAALLLIGGGYFGYNGLEAKSLAAPISLQRLTSSLGDLSFGFGSTGAPSTDKVSASDLANYSVAPTLPRYIMIPKLNVEARVFAVGLDSSGAIGTPSNVYDTDWYNGSAKPGQPGAMVIDGHVASWATSGVFYKLKNLVSGDTMTVERGDGTIYNYKVIKTVIYPASNVDMAAVMAPAVAGHPGLNLISCTGTVPAGSSQYTERVVVFSEQV